MVDAGRGSRRDLRFCVIGDPEAGGLDHRDIVGSVAGHERFIGGQIVPPRELTQSCKLCRAPEDRLGDFAGEPAICVYQQPVGAALVEADHCRNAVGEQREAAGHQAGICPVPAHGRNQRARPG